MSDEVLQQTARILRFNMGCAKDVYSNVEEIARGADVELERCREICKQLAEQDALDVKDDAGLPVYKSNLKTYMAEAAIK